MTSITSQVAPSLTEDLADLDPEIAGFINQELDRQQRGLEMIASENHTPLAVMQAQGSVLTNKYAEGYPGRRYYGGCEHADSVERLAIERVKNLFGAQFANVQPHSGAQANAAVMHALIRPGDTVMGLNLAHGGHLTHGMKLNFSGRLYNIVPYSVDENTYEVDMDEVARLAREHQPKMIVAGWSAYPRQLDFARFREIADEVGAYLFVDMAHFAGLVAGKVFAGEEDPIPYADVVTTTTHKSLRGPRGGLVLTTKEYADVVDRGCPLVLGGPLGHVIAAKAVALAEARTQEFRTYAQDVVDNAKALAEGLLSRGAKLVTGGTDNHLVLIDVTGYDLTGRQAESALLDAGIVSNRNSVPNDPNGAWYTSGVRLGTPALTSRGFNASDMDAVAQMVHEVLSSTTAAITKSGKPGKAKYDLSAEVAQNTKDSAAGLLANHPLYPGLEL